MSRLWLFFAVQRLCCYSEIQSGMRTLEESEGRQKCLRVREREKKKKRKTFGLLEDRQGNTIRL